MVRFLHTSDWHLGIPFRRLGSQGEKARDIRWETGARIIRRAAEEKVDFALVAGDLFDSNHIDQKWVKLVVELVAEVAPFPIYFLPGNHDPLSRDSLYLLDVWKDVDNAVVLDEARPIEIGDEVVLFPCPLSQKESRRDPTGWIEGNPDKISIGLAHGDLVIESIQEPNFPIARDRTKVSHLDYLALGDWHSRRIFEDSDRVERIVYPGSPEATKYGEDDSGRAVVVEIDGPGEVPHIEEWKVATLHWNEWSREIHQADDLAGLVKDCQQLEDCDRQLVRCRLDGVIEPALWEEVDQWQRDWEGKVFHLEVDRSSLHLRPQPGGMEGLLPQGEIFRKVALALQALMKNNLELQPYSSLDRDEALEILGDLSEVESTREVESEVLERACLLLYKLTREVTS